MENNQKLEDLKQILENDGVILIATDTIWGISCLANNEIAINKINNIKKRDESKTMIILVSDHNMLSKYIYQKDNIDNMSFEYPTTIIYNYDQFTDLAKTIIPKNVIKDDNTIAIRAVGNNNKELSQVISYLNKPIISTSANISGGPSPEVFEDIDKEIVDAVDYIYHIEGRKPKAKPSNIVKIENDQIIYIRK